MELEQPQRAQVQPKMDEFESSQHWGLKGGIKIVKISQAARNPSVASTAATPPPPPHLLSSKKHHQSRW